MKLQLLHIYYIIQPIQDGISMWRVNEILNKYKGSLFELMTLGHLQGCCWLQN